MTPAAVEARVLDIDLRERYEDLLSFGSFTEVQHAFAQSFGLDEADLTRVLIIDDTRELERHAQAIELIARAPGVKRLICLAVGPSLDDGNRGMTSLLFERSGESSRAAIRRPFELASHATLWVGDARGVGWGLGNQQPSVLATGPTPASGPLLEALIDALLSPQVFDEVYEKVRTMPSAVASPGLRVMIGQVDDDVLADARARAIDRILAPHQGGEAAQPAVDLVTEPFRLLLRLPRVSGAGNPILAVGGEMSRVAAGTRDLVSTARSALSQVTQPGPVLWNLRARAGGAGVAPQYSQAGRLANSVQQAGVSIERLGKELTELFERHDSLHPLGTTALDELRGRGFALTPPDDTTRPDLLAALRELVESALDSFRPVTEVTSWLHWMHQKLVPTGSGARVAEVAGICHPDRMAFLRGMPHRLVVRLASLLAVLPVLVGAALTTVAAGAGSGDLGAWAGTAAVALAAVRGWPLVVARRMTPLATHQLSDLVFLVLVALTTVAGAFGLFAVGGRDAASYLPIAAGLGALVLIGLLGWWLLLGRDSEHAGGTGPGGRPLTGGSPVDLLSLVVTAIAGAHVGLVIGTAPRLEELLSLPVRIAAVALALTALMWWPHLVWSRAVRAWGPQQYVDQAAAATEAIVMVMEDTARYDWSLTGPRRAGADLVRAMSLAFEDISAILSGYSDRLRGFPAQPPRTSQPGVDVDVALRLRTKGTAISEVVKRDVTALTANVIERCWPDIEREALDALQNRVGSETRDALDRYDRHLARVGVLVPPPFRDEDADRRDIADDVWSNCPPLAALLRAPVTDSGLMQLCDPAHLQILDVNAQSAAAVRSAPSAAQSTLLSRGSDFIPTTGNATGPLPSDVLADLVWTDWGQAAGVLRLVRMRPGTVDTVLKEGR